MKKLLTGAILSTALLTATASLAADKTIKLSVPGMNCVSCPYMVREAIAMVDGIKSVEATMEDHSATVTFDDAVTNVDEIREATANIGYPSTLVQ